MNKQIAEKLGWVWVPYPDCLWHIPNAPTEDGIDSEYELPDFTHSMDACVKYIVPWLIERGYAIKLVSDEDGHYAGIFNGSLVSESEKGALSEAICKAFMEV